MNRAVDLDSAGLRPWTLRMANQYWPGKNDLILNANQLVKTAKQKTGSSDLGKDWDPIALEVLVDSINNEAQLSPVGFFIIKQRLIGSLITRLRAQKWFKRHPEILEQEIAPICLITGLQRTGTTYLQRLLAMDKTNRSLMSWESLDPVPHGKRDETNVRIRNTRLSEKALSWMAPSFFAIHPIDYKRPEEDVLLLDSSFLSTAPEAIMHVPSYADWLEKQDQSRAYQWERQMLQLLQWQRPAKRWILKSPHHLEFLDDFIHVFPDTKVVWAHRDPLKCLPSFLSMIYHGRAIFSEQRNLLEVANHWMRKSQRIVDQGVLARHTLPPDSILDIEFDSLLNHPVKLIERIYRFLDYEFNAEFERYLQEEISNHARHRFGAHKYTMRDFGLNELKVRELYANYYNAIPKISQDA